MKNILPIALFCAELSNAAVLIKEKKSFRALGMVADEAMALAAVDFDEAAKELKTVDTKALSEKIKEKVDFEDDVLEERVEGIMTAALGLASIGSNIYKMFPKKAK